MPLTELTATSLQDIDLVIEVAHPDVIHAHAKLILEHADLFIGSPTALANQATFDVVQEALKRNRNRSVFVPSGALWGANDIQRMANLGILKVGVLGDWQCSEGFQGLTITMLKHPRALRVEGQLQALCQRASKEPVVLYDGGWTDLCFPSHE